MYVAPVLDGDRRKWVDFTVATRILSLWKSCFNPVEGNYYDYPYASGEWLHSLLITFGTLIRSD